MTHYIEEINRKYRILLVDDDANERKGVRFLIEREKFPLLVSEASNGRRAFEIICNEPIDILFTDVKMPYMDGLELSSKVNELFPKIKIIIFSAYGEFEYAKQAMAARAVGYLLKPVDVAEFKRVMAGVIRRCNEDVAEAIQRRRQSEADLKLQWISILLGRISVSENLKSRLALQGYPVDKKIVLISLEAQEDYFAKSEEQLLSCLKANISDFYEYINLYPNRSYVILFSKPDKSQLISLTKKLRMCVESGGDSLSVFVSDICGGLSELPLQLQRVEDIRRQLFLWNVPVLFMSELDESARQGVGDIEQKWEQVAKTLETRNKADIISQIKELLDVLSEHSLLSAVYVRHIFCDLLNKLFLEYGYSQSEEIQNTIRELGGCSQKQEILSLFVEVMSREAFNDQTCDVDVSRVIQNVMRIIKNQYGMDLSLDYIAANVGLAPAYLSYIFRRETGETLIKFLTDFRMQRAKQLLCDGKYKVIQVAQLCGYENQSYFNRLFKNAFGITPKQYREKHNEAEE